MKSFFISILLFYLTANIYAAIRIYQLVPPAIWIRTTVMAIYLLGFASLLIFFRFGESMPVWSAGLFYRFGTSWMIALLYICLLLILVDLLRIVNHFTHIVDKERVAAMLYHNGTTAAIGLE